MSEMTGQHISEGPIYFTLCPHSEPSRVQRSCFGKTRHKSDITMSCFQKKKIMTSSSRYGFITV